MTVTTVGGIRYTIEGDSTSLDKAHANAETKMKNLDKTSEATSANVAKYAGLMAKAYVAAMTAIAYAGYKVINQAHDLQNAAAGFGITTKQMQGLEYAASTAGIGVEQMTATINRLYSLMEQRGVMDEGTRIFGALGLSAKNSKGELKSVADFLPEIADRFSKMADGAAKSRLVVMLFGEQGLKLLPILNKGKAGIAELTAEAERLGLVLGSQTQKEMTAFWDSMHKIQAAGQGQVNMLVTRLLPALQTYADKMNDMSKSSRGANLIIEAVVYTFKAFFIAVDGVVTQFERFAIMTHAVYEAVKKLGGGDFSGAFTDLKKGVAEAGTAMDDFHNRAKRVWNDTVSVAQESGKKLAQSAAPIVQSSEEMQKALELHKKNNEYLLNDIMSDKRLTPAEKFDALEAMVKSGTVSVMTFTEQWRLLNQEMERDQLQKVIDTDTAPLLQKLQAIEDAKQKGIIGWKEYADATKMVNDQNTRNMDDLLSATSGALTAIFKKSKTAAIASALINTYQGITKAIAQYPPPLSYAMAGIQGALGFAQVAAIRSQSESSGGGSGSSASSAAASSPTPAAQPAATQSTLTVQGLNPNGLFSGQFVRDFAEKLLDYQRDGGRVVLSS